MGERHGGSYKAISIASIETVSSGTVSTDSMQATITCDMVRNLYAEGDIPSYRRVSAFNAPTPTVSEAGEVDWIVSTETINIVSADEDEELNQQLMIVFKEGDINCALYFLINSLHEPFASNAVANVLVEESIRKEFVERIVDSMQPLPSHVARHPDFQTTLAMLEKIKSTQKIRAPISQVPLHLESPILLVDFPCSNLGARQTGAICVNSFTTVADIVNLCQKENLSFVSACLWNEFVEPLYQLVVSLKCPTFYFNCCNVDLTPINNSFIENKIDARLVDGFHYETLQIEEEMKIIVFPIGAHLKTKSQEPEKIVSPISLLNE